MSIRFICFCFFWVGGSIGALGQNKMTISGFVSDADSGEKLISANVYDLKSKKGNSSNAYGFYSLTLPQDTVYLSISYTGYDDQLLVFYPTSDTTLHFALDANLELTEVEVVAKTSQAIERSSQMSTVDVPIAQIKQIPALFGEQDVLKALQLLPGVQSGGEGQSGLYVRGGSPDQNLILLDGVPVYNAAHLFGFFSVFNVDAIKDVKLTKGGFPARYGGRLSAVLEINMKEGHQSEWHGTGTIGLIASKLTLEGPLKKDKTSVLLSARRTYIDVLAKPLIKQSFKDNGSTGTAGYFFHDINAKINHQFSDQDRLYFSVYTGKDRFYFEEAFQDPFGAYQTQTGLQWGNVTAALRWNHLWNQQLFSNATLTFSHYTFDTEALEEDRDFGTNEFSSFGVDYLSGINDWAAKIDFDYVPHPDHYIRFGASIIDHRFKPGVFDLTFSLDDRSPLLLDTLLGQEEINAQELAAYFENDLRLGNAFKMNIGIHFSAFNVPGKFYYSFQPRWSMRYLFDGGLACKASFATMRQYVQLLTNEGIGLPTDLWLPTTEQVLPQDSWQAALGVAKTFRQRYEISVEAYYKKMNHVLSYREGATLFELSDWQTRVTQGQGESYGIELFVQKKLGQLTGWLGYTLSWSNRQFAELNFGKTYPFKYDRRHDLSWVVAYRIKEGIQISATWVFGTGNAVTLANSQFEGIWPSIELPTNVSAPWSETYTADYYADRNNFRVRNYHRLDVGIEFTKKKRRYDRTWAFGAYNVYSNQNPFFIFTDTQSEFDENGNFKGREQVLKQASLFPIIPYAAYRFSF
ncbi:MAG: TonB-dependent receptor plug domain-containing protein [Bacteroidota bacterium]